MFVQTLKDYLATRCIVRKQFNKLRKIGRFAGVIHFSTIHKNGHSDVVKKKKVDIYVWLFIRNANFISIQDSSKSDHPFKLCKVSLSISIRYLWLILVSNSE